MPVEKRSNGCYKVHNTDTKKCLSKKEASKQLAAIEITKHMQESVEKKLPKTIMYRGKKYIEFDPSNPIVGGVGDNTHPDPKELKKGEEVEKEHVGNLNNPVSIAIAKDIARDHIAESPKYYDKLAKMEKTLDKK